MSRIWLFRSIVGLAGLGLIVAFELLLCVWSDLQPPPLVVELAWDRDQALKSINGDYSSRFFFERHNGRLIATGQMAARPFVEPRTPKPLRIVIVGASTVQGYPHSSRLSAAAFLQAMLQDAVHERPVEVFGLGIVAIGSFGVARVVEDALHSLKPDVVVVYTGHNEFFGVYGVHSSPIYNRFHYSLFQFRTPRLVRKVVNSIRGKEVGDKDLLEILAARSDAPLSSSRRELAKDYLQANLGEIHKACQHSGVPLVLCTLVANDTGFAPVGAATTTLDPEAMHEWQRTLDISAAILTKGTRPSTRERKAVLSNLQVLLEQTPENAWVWYLWGRALETEGKNQEAFDAYRRARDLDAMPWRAPTSHNETIRSLALQSGVLLADVEAAFLERSPLSGIGWTLMEDHVHPSVNGQALLAWTVASTVAPLFGLHGALTKGDTDYVAKFGELPVERVATDRAMARLLGEAPMERYNGPTARMLSERAAAGWQRLTQPEQDGAKAWEKHRANVPLVLKVADQFHDAGNFAEAERHYAASRLQAPYTPRGDLWAAVQWARCRLLLGKQTDAHTIKLLRDALRRVEFVTQAPNIDPSFIHFTRGMFYYFLKEHAQALTNLEQAFEHPGFRQEFAYNLFPPMAEELIRAGRHVEAKEHAQTLSQEKNGDSFFPDKVDTLILGGSLFSGKTQ